MDRAQEEHREVRPGLTLPGSLRDACASGKIQWQKHALAKMLERGIRRSDVTDTVANGEIIEFYPSDRPFPSVLVHHEVHGAPVHVVAAFDSASGMVYIITAYRPDQRHFMNDNRTRRAQI